MERRCIVNIIVLGGSNVGKTSLIRRYVDGDFSLERRVTLGVDFETKMAEVRATPVTIQIFDTAGQERHQGLIPASFFRTADGALLVYDVTAKESWEQLLKWHEELQTKLPEALRSDFPIIVLANKIDGTSTEVDEAMAAAWCQEREYPLLRTSAKEDIGVKVAVEAIAALALESKAIRAEKLSESGKSAALFKDTVDFSKNHREPPPSSCC